MRKMSEQQNQLMTLLCRFTASTWYQVRGKNISDVIKYMNVLARVVDGRRDEILNKQFDEMTAIQLEGPNHHIDLIAIIGSMLIMSCAADYDVHAWLEDHYRDKAQYLRGCTSDHEHSPIVGDIFEIDLQLDKN